MRIELREDAVVILLGDPELMQFVKHNWEIIRPTFEEYMTLLPDLLAQYYAGSISPSDLARWRANAASIEAYRRTPSPESGKERSNLG